MSERSKDSMIKNISAEDLRAKLANKESGQWYLILDNAILDTLPNKPQFFKASNWEFLLDNTSFAKMRKDGAIVARLSSDSPWLDWFFDESATDAAILVSSHFSFEELIEQLRKLSIAAVSGSEKTYLFRFYDPRNISQLLNSFTEEEWHKFLGPMSEIYWWEREQGNGKNKLCHVSNPQPARSPLNQPLWLFSQSTVEVLSSIAEQLWADDLIPEMRRYGLATEVATLDAKAASVLAARIMADLKAVGACNKYNFYDWAEQVVKYGYQFDTDPQYPWATVHPRNENLEEKIERIRAMVDEFEAIALYGEGEAGADEGYGTWEVGGRFWRRLRLVKFDDLDRPDTLAKTMAALKRLYPERFRATELDGLKMQLKRAEELALQHNLPLVEGRAILGAVMWLEGCSVWEDDPSRPWCARVLKRLEGNTPKERAAWLFTHLKRRMVRPSRLYRLSEVEEGERALRRLSRDMHARFHQFTLADMERLDENDDKAIVGIINYVGKNYLPTVDIERVRLCRIAAVRETRISPIGKFFAKLSPLFGCSLFYHFMLTGIGPPDRSENQERVIEWLHQDSLNMLTSDTDKLNYLRETFTDILVRVCGWGLFDEDLMRQDAADDNIFDPPVALAGGLLN